MRKTLTPMVLSLLLCGAAAVALVVPKARAEPSKAPRPIMVALTTRDMAQQTAAQAMQNPIMLAQSEPRAMRRTPPPPPDMDERPRCNEIYADRVGDLASLETRLSLTAQQGSLFGRWKQVSLDNARREESACRAAMRAGPGQGDLLSGLAQEEDMLRQRLAALQAERPALEAFYRGLNPGQRAEFERAGQQDGPPGPPPGR